MRNWQGGTLLLVTRQEPSAVRQFATLFATGRPRVAGGIHRRLTDSRPTTGLVLQADDRPYRYGIIGGGDGARPGRPEPQTLMAPQPQGEEPLHARNVTVRQHLVPT
jgi:hypothetical protein